MALLNPFSTLDSGAIVQAAAQYGTPVYLYDEAMIRNRCRKTRSMPNPYGLTVRYAMKAQSTRAILQVIHSEGLCIDASSLNEVRRAVLADIPPQDITLTTQEVPTGDDRSDLEALIRQGLHYNVCSLRQLTCIADFAAAEGIPLSIRIHPGVGAGETATRNTGDNYSCFGVHLSDLGEALQLAGEKGLTFRQVHAHIGSGGDPEKWRQNIDLQLSIVEAHFPEAISVSFGGGLKEARMPGESAANIEELGAYAKARLEEFAARTGRRLKMEIEPGTYIMANSGYAVTSVIDKKRTGPDGLNFILADGGMEINARPLLYGSEHPFYLISQDGTLISSEFDLPSDSDYEAVIVGKCCESGDAQSLDFDGVSKPRKMGEPRIGDLVVIGGTGAYCSAMTPFNYNSHLQAPEILINQDGGLQCIRIRQSMEQLTANERSVFF